MTTRERNHQLKIYLAPNELEFFKQKYHKSRCKSMSHLIRKCVLEKNIYVIDMKPFREIQHLLSKTSTNINQIPKQANTNGIIYKNGIMYLTN